MLSFLNQSALLLPAAAVASFSSKVDEGGYNPTMLPSDHFVSNKKALIQAVEKALPIATSGKLVTFGIKAQSPEIGYGYIKRGRPLPKSDRIFEVDKFIEKPPLELAKSFVEEGRNYDWNSGLFLFSCKSYLEELKFSRNPDGCSRCRMQGQ